MSASNRRWAACSRISPSLSLLRGASLIFYVPMPEPATLEEPPLTPEAPASEFDDGRQRDIFPMPLLPATYELHCILQRFHVSLCRS